MRTTYSKPCRKGRAGRRVPERIVGFLKYRLNKVALTKTWLRFDPYSLAKILGISVRSVWRAKSYLQDHQGYYGVKFVTVRKGSHWEVLVSLTVNLKWDELPLCYTEEGKCRRVKKEYRSRDLLRHTIVFLGVLTDARISIRRKPADKNILNGVSSTRSGKFKLRKRKSKNWRKKNDRYAHSVTRELERYHWDNCKVRHHHGSCYGLVKNLLMWGATPRMIMGLYWKYLQEVHGEATDTGLNKGNPTMIFGPAPIYRRIYEYLGFYRISTERGEIYTRVE